MRKGFVGIIGIIALVLCSASAMAGTIDFEGLPDANYYYGGGQNIGDYYAGVRFQADATILDSAIYGYSSFNYPPHSGTAVMFSYNQGAITAFFDTEQSNVSLWYTSFSSFHLDAYNSSGVLLGSALGPSNIGSNGFLSVSAANIAWVTMHDSGNYYTVDDFSCDSCTGKTRAVPEPSTLLLIGSGLTGLGLVRRRFKG